MVKLIDHLSKMPAARQRPEQGTGIAAAPKGADTKYFDQSKSPTPKMG